MRSRSPVPGRQALRPARSTFRALATCGWLVGLLTSIGPAGCAGSASRAAPPVPSLGAPQPPAFVSFNIPNLHYIEDDTRFDSLRHQRLPDEFEIRDGLETIRFMGGRVVRIYVLSVRKATDPPGVVRHVLGPGQFNEDAFVALDRVLAIAAELDLRVILPFVDNWPPVSYTHLTLPTNREV